MKTPILDQDVLATYKARADSIRADLFVAMADCETARQLLKAKLAAIAASLPETAREAQATVRVADLFNRYNAAIATFREAQGDCLNPFHPL